MTLHIIELLSIVRIRIPRSICSFGRQNKCMQLRAKVNPTRSDPSLRDIYHRDSRSLTVQTNATYPYWTILSENMGLNMSCMSHPLYDLTAVASLLPGSTDCCERLQQCGPGGRDSGTSTTHFSSDVFSWP